MRQLVPLSVLRVRSQGSSPTNLVGVLALALLGCSSDVSRPSDAIPGMGEGPGDSCALCGSASPSGGETSDFGGRGPLTPCEQTEVSTSIDAAEARQRGFGVGLDGLERDFSTELGWTIRTSPVRAVGAEQYLSRSTLTGTIRITDLVLVASSLAECEPRLGVGIDLSIRIEDGALIAAGALGATVTRFGHPEAGGIFAPSDVRTMLSAIPGLPAPRMVRQVSLNMQLWPDSVRGTLSFVLPEPGAEPVDGGIRGDLVEGIFPIDDCPADSAPLAPATASAALGGLSPNQVNERLDALLRQRMPEKAVWRDGRETTVTLGTGSSLDNVCVREADGATGAGAFSYDVPLLIKSADARVNVASSAHSYVQISKDGAIERASLEIFDQDHWLTQKELPKVAGISGVELGAAQQLFWYAELQLKRTDQELACRGLVGVEDYNMPDVLAPIAKLAWGPQPGFP